LYCTQFINKNPKKYLKKKKSFINYIQTRERGASAGGASGGRGLAAGCWLLSA
jgi:hypothetical protein